MNTIELATTTIQAEMLPGFLDPLTLLGYFGPWALAGLLLVLAVESGILFPLLPGDSLLFVAGMVTAAGGKDGVPPSPRCGRSCSWRPSPQSSAPRSVSSSGVPSALVGSA